LVIGETSMALNYGLPGSSIFSRSKRRNFSGITACNA